MTDLQRQYAASVVDGTIGSWEALAAVPTGALPVPIVKVWVEESTGISRTTRLLASTEATDQALGIQRPNDFDETTNAKVWFAAG